MSIGDLMSIREVYLPGNAALIGGDQLASDGY